MKSRKVDRSKVIDLGSAKSQTKGSSGFIADEVLTQPEAGLLPE